MPPKTVWRSIILYLQFPIILHGASARFVYIFRKFIFGRGWHPRVESTTLTREIRFKRPCARYINGHAFLPIQFLIRVGGGS